ncbi:MAG: LPS export ABC transporter ATP-binding protein [Candidatus Sumerlaeia bacterium]|nr:LPS export ABC transporter ATP-binding protein [Candidatus Sumerlaeia bacterium]
MTDKKPGTKTIRAENLVKDYGSKRVVKNVNLEVHSGEVVGLLGANGAGKSTTFKMLVGFTKPTEGRVFFDDREISHLPIQERARLGIGYLAQEPSIFRKMSVRENLMAVMQALGYSKKEIRPKVNELIEELGIGHLQKNIAERLSGGEKRRLEIARAMMTDPSFIFLDEPFTGIDPPTVEDIQGIVRTLADKGLGILITDHNLRETMKITDRSYILLEGEVIVSGSVTEIVANATVRKKFLTETIAEDLTRVHGNKPPSPAEVSPPGENTG